MLEKKIFDFIEVSAFAEFLFQNNYQASLELYEQVRKDFNVANKPRNVAYCYEFLTNKDKFTTTPFGDFGK